MKFSYEDQIGYVKLALALFDWEKGNASSIESILEFGELIKKHSEENNAVIYDATEYLYEQLQLIRGEEGAFDNVELRVQLEEYVK